MRGSALGDEGLGLALGLEGSDIWELFSWVVGDSGFALSDGGQSLLGGFTLMTEYLSFRGFAFPMSCGCHWQTLPCLSGI